MAQRLLLIRERILQRETDLDLEFLGVEYSVLGSTGNVYSVELPKDAARDFTCTCPDHTMRKRKCKHICFVQCKVLERTANRKELWNGALRRLNEQRREHESAVKREAVQKPWQNEPCVQCFEPLRAREQIQWCNVSCGTTVHLACWKRWSESGNGILCPHCHISWA